jgi:hypothetical protein
MYTDLRDEILSEATDDIGPIEVKFVGNWPRVEEALDGLPHGQVRYRWSTDSTNELALLIEVPLEGNPPQSALGKFREQLRAALNELDGDRPVYIHFVDSESLAETDV